MSQNDLKQVLVQDSSFMTELLDFANSYEPEYDSEDYDAPPTNTSEVQAALETLVSDAYERPVKEGVWCLDNAVPESLVDTLNEEIEKLAQASPVDYHPNSKNMVRDIVHPALFAYKNPNYENESNKRDFFGRDYEGSKFQWLPTDYLVSKDSQGERTVEIAGYINNISINRNDRDTLGLYSALEELFKYALPLFEFALGYLDMRSMFFNFEETELDTEEYEDFSFGSPYVTPRSIDSARLQVITKIVDYEIPSEGGDYSGVWHVEGMSHENIVATCLFVPYQDEGCVGGEIHFKRSMDPNELTDLYFNINQDRSEVVEDFFVQGKSVVFPYLNNSHQIFEIKDLLFLGRSKPREVVWSYSQILTFIVFTN